MSPLHARDPETAPRREWGRPSGPHAPDPAGPTTTCLHLPTIERRTTPMAHGITLKLRKILRPPGVAIEGTEVTPRYTTRKSDGEQILTGYSKPGAAHSNPDKDRSLNGKARIRARRAARKAGAR